MAAGARSWDDGGKVKGFEGGEIILVVIYHF